MVQFLFLIAAYSSSGALAQVPTLRTQSDVWNSSFTLSKEQIAQANISQDVAHNVEVALNFERTNNAGSLIQDDPFYQLPASYNYSDPQPPGTVLKVEEYTNTGLYTLPMSIAMSRFLYMSESYTGQPVPASALVLWPYMPRTFPDLRSYASASINNSSSEDQPVWPTVAWAHGSTGQGQACGVSGFRNLGDEFHQPFAYALAGYAVVAPDYAGLGVPNVTTNYFFHPAVANDFVNAVIAARKAWPDSLSMNFVVAGQSQGGATAWATAQREARRPTPGYLGTIAASPFTNTLADIAAEAIVQTNVRIAGIARGIRSVLPNFQLSEWLTDAGLRRLRLLEEIDGCILTGSQLANDGVQIIKDDWNETATARWYNEVVMNGGKPFAGPMLVLQGTDDPNAYEPTTTRSVKETCEKFPNSQLEYLRFENITHVPVLYASQHKYLDWIRDRFAGVPALPGCSMRTLKPPRPKDTQAIKAWQRQTWFLEYDAYGI